MLIALCVVIIGLYLIYLPLNIKVHGMADMEAGRGEFSFSLFNIRVFRAEGLLEIRSLTESDLIIMRRRKRSRVHVAIDRGSVRKTIDKLRRLDLSLIANVNVRDLSLRLKYGNGDAFKTTLYLGLIKMLFYSLASALKCRHSVDIEEEFVPEYNMRMLKCEFYGIFSLSVGDIIYGFIRGRINKLRRRLRAWRARKRVAERAVLSEAAAEAAKSSGNPPAKHSNAKRANKKNTHKEKESA